MKSEIMIGTILVSGVSNKMTKQVELTETRRRTR